MSLMSLLMKEPGTVPSPGLKPDTESLCKELSESRGKVHLLHGALESAPPQQQQQQQLSSKVSMLCPCLV